jgi:hypothetical protein
MSQERSVEKGNHDVDITISGAVQSESKCGVCVFGLQICWVALLQCSISRLRESSVLALANRKV